ncbi:MAG: hypothetical protein ACM3ZE_03405 [Myxococcales bacterium]
MNSKSRIWAKCFASAMMICACGSNHGTSDGTAGTGNAISSTTSSTLSSGRGTTTTKARSLAASGGNIEQTMGSGGATGGASRTSAKGGTNATTSLSASGGSGADGQGGTVTHSSVSIPTPSSGGIGGNSSAESSGSAGKNASVPDTHAIGNPRHVLLLDEGNRRVVLMDLQSPSTAVWSRQIEASKYGDSMRDVQLVGGDRVAVSVAKGYVELDLKTGEIKKEVTSFTRIESLRRLPSGNTILGSNDGGVTLQELDPKDALVSGRKVTFTALQELRLFRRTPQGTFLVGLKSKLAEVNWDGQIVWEMTIPNGDYVYMGVRQEKNIAVTSGYGATLLIIEPSAKKVVATLGGKTQSDSATIAPNFYAGFQLLANGHYVVTNWEGHGSSNGSRGVQLLEYDASGALVWKWKQDAKLVSSLHHVLVLDGLDTTRLHDDVNGVLAPVTQ